MIRSSNTTIGILAHVDAGKTTLSESILYKTGALRSKGRVDHGDAYLDTDALEKKRGITIFSKLARFTMPAAAKGAEPSGQQVRGQTQGQTSGQAQPAGKSIAAPSEPQAGTGSLRQFTLLDTPGHVDFSPEMERTLRVLDLAILVISAPDGITPQVRLLWKLLRQYEVPTFIYVNKMDLVETGNAEHDAFEKRRILEALTGELGSSVVEFGRGQLSSANEESIAVCDDVLMEHFLDGTHVTAEDVCELIHDRKLFPLYYGAALEDRGTKDLLEGILRYTVPEEYPEDFGALVYKVTREPGKSGARLVWMKLTGGSLHVRDSVTQPVHGRTESEDEEADAVSMAAADPGRSAGKRETDGGGEDGTDASEPSPAAGISEKITGIRRYSGSRFEAVTEAAAGDVVAVTGLSSAMTGDGLGFEKGTFTELLSPIMTCQVIPSEGTDTFTLVRALRGIEEEEPMLHVLVNEETGDVTIQIMGQIQLQILQNLIQERYGLSVTFGPETIVYKETIQNTVEGVGHFEPLRHYAEVHLLLEPTGVGSGLTFENRCAPNTLEKNWQRLVMTHLQEKTFKGVLTGSDITDMKITLIGGRASKKHTSGGDFRQATYRAVRQGLMMAENVLLEPVLAFRLEVPKENLGRALNDISSMHGSAEPAVFTGEMAEVEGSVPASELGDYAQQVAAYTSGQGSLSVSLKDYEPCHNAEEVVEQYAYDPEADLRNPSSSVFCSHGAGTVVPWDQVRTYMQVDTGWRPEGEDGQSAQPGSAGSGEPGEDAWARSGDIDPTGAGQHGAAGPAGAAGHSTPQNGRRRQQDDFAERQRRLEAGEKELRAIFEATYGPIKERLHHPENERYFRQAGQDAAGNETPQNEIRENGQQENGVPGETGSWTDGNAAASSASAASTSAGTAGAPGSRRGSSSDTKWKDKGRAPEEYLLVDGYNIIWAWAQLHDLAETDIKAARDRLLDILGNYAGYVRENVIVVFDAYRVPGGSGEVIHLPSLDVVYTKEAETADLYIEKTAHQLTRHHRVTVATSDAVEQVIIYGSGAIRLSARGLLEQVLAAEEEMRERYLN